ncbi:hypothetical protein NA57DRAFT_39625 [Rhizodiscina lignyota]|uniref:Ino eighty subunit 1 n=1 Tax=Rhizodiscina lignyota TaxID=1504668 RepID=A0A9P4M8M4_9PEZI|nr:hypothetical protein NA57DRAFT_39625 [Rhizodiscina lignyota]
MPKRKANPNLSHLYDDVPSDAPSPRDGGSGGEQPHYTSTTTTTRRNANGSVSSVYSGNKIRHLKKEDGVPLWRKDIQYDFLKYVFEDDKKAFTKVSDSSKGHTFADIYLDAMAKSSKCSKILKDKLLTERSAAINMAMVCLLVNVGRMNTTLNFFPEMRAQLRTYHSIPSLQAQQDPNAYKQLQDAPRLKSILKGATEDSEQPSTLEDIRTAPVPRTNPVNLIFVLSQYAPKISEMHFDVPRDFFDLVMKSGLSSRSRATAFLWLMWWYLESDFSEHDALNNPYGPGRKGENAGPGDMSIKTPQFDILTDEQAAAENVDTEEEKQFGEVKRQERINILASDALAPVVTGPKRFTNNPVFSVVESEGAASPIPDQGQSPAPSMTGRLPCEEYHTDSDQTRSMSPQPHGSTLVPKSTPGGMRIEKLLNDETPSGPPPPPATGSTPLAPIKLGRGNWSKAKREAAAAANATLQKQRQAAGMDVASPAASTGPAAPAANSATGPHGFYLPLNGSEPSHKRTRPLTAHQIAVEQFRKKRVEYLLHKKLESKHKSARSRRTREGAMARTWKQVRMLPDGFDSEEELHISLVQRQEGMTNAIPYRGFAGFRLVEGIPVYQDFDKVDDSGEQVHTYRQAFSRMRRRLDRWEHGLEVVRKKRPDPEDRVVDTVEEGDDAGDDSEADRDMDGDGDRDGDGMDLEGRSSLPPEEGDEADEELDDVDGSDEDEIMGDA